MPRLEDPPLDTAADDGITVTELPDDDAPGTLFGTVLGAYHHHGYDAGYRRAIIDARAALIEAAEAFARLPTRASGGADPRAIVDAFADRLDRQLRRLGGSEGPQFFEDGSGI